MLLILSPSKTLDFESELKFEKFSQPELLEDAKILAGILKKMNAADLAKLMDISPRLSELTVKKYREWDLPVEKLAARQAVFAFIGDVYGSMDIASFSAQDLDFTQQNLRILSGLYGILRPFDLIKPYRLEMNTALKNRRGENLCQFWGDKISRAVNTVLVENKSRYLVNLASKEYSESIDLKKIKAEIITPTFREYKNGKFNTTVYYLKKARGMMARYILQNRIIEPGDIQLFNEGGYYFDEKLSKNGQWYFIR